MKRVWSWMCNDLQRRENSECNLAQFDTFMVLLSSVAFLCVRSLKSVPDLMYVWRCIIYENDERYQLDATIMIYYHKWLYMFRSSICPSSGVQVVYCCMWCWALGVVTVVLRSWCVVLCTLCEFVSESHRVHKTTHRFLRTATTPNAEHHMQQHTTCTPEDGHIDVRNM